MSSDVHNRTVKIGVDEADEEDLDPVDRMLKKAGCAELHYKIQECMVDHKDWRKCQTQVQAFKECIEKSQHNEKK